MQPILCYYKPASVPADAVRSAWLRARVQAALDAGLTPALLPSVGLERLSVAMPPALVARIRELADQWGVAPGRMVGMLSAAIDHTAKPPADPSPRQPAATERPEQVRLLAAAAPLIDAGRIVLIEAGTGIGKSRLAGLLAAHALQHDRSNVVIATPTISQIAHLADELNILRTTSSGGASLPLPTLLLGRSNFIDIDAAFAVAVEAGYQQAIDWIESGAPPGLTAATTALARHVPQARGLMDDWMHLIEGSNIAEDYFADDFALTDESSEESAAVYQALRLAAMGQPVVLCTHTMLAADCIAKKRDQAGLLPDPDLLVIDEAHAFEQELANVATQGVSLWSLHRLLSRDTWTALRAGSVAADAASTAKDCIAQLAQLPLDASSSLRLPQDLQSDHAIAARWPPCAALLDRLHDALEALSAKLSKAKDITGWRNAHRQVRAASRAIGFATAGTHDVTVTLSPVRKLANLSVGPRSVAHYLRHLWDSCGSAALMSATLYVPTARGDTSFYITKILSLPADRVSQTAAEHPAWITSTPALMLPDKAAASLLTPPTGPSISPQALATWIDQVGLVVRHVASSAAGGTLVLLSGYERLDLLAKAISAELGERLVIQRPNKGVARCDAEFRALAQRGLQPVWLATGGAWTGLDLRDKAVPDDQAQKDTLLTDLVIPNIPLGLSGGTTHAARREAFLPVEGMATALLFRQGLGRLIRRSGLRDRRIWMLDARLLTFDSLRSGSIYSPCLMMLERFSRRERFAMPSPSRPAPELKLSQRP